MKQKRLKRTIELNPTKQTRIDFQRMRSVLACVSTKPDRPVLHHVLVEPSEEEGFIQITATDGKRLRSDSFEMQAAPGCYEIKANTARGIYLIRSRKKLNYPNYRQVIPSLEPKDAFTLRGAGKQFVIWASSALGCLLDSELIAVRDDELVTLSIQKNKPERSPAVLKNNKTLFVLMPTQVDDTWHRELETMRVALAA